MGFVGAGVHVRDSNVYGALFPTGPKASNEDVSVIIFICWPIIAGLVVWARFYVFSRYCDHESRVRHILLKG